MNWPEIRGKTVLHDRTMGHKDRRSLKLLIVKKNMVKYRNQIIKGTK